MSNSPIDTGCSLLAADEPSPIHELAGNDLDSDFLLIVDHASARIPRSLDGLGLDASDLRRHIAWDIGALAVAERLSALLRAPLIAQNYSRLVIDCNRDPSLPSSAPAASENTRIPGNIDLTTNALSIRSQAIFEPYHSHIHDVLERRDADKRKTILDFVHSMTNVYKGQHRPMHAAILYGRDPRFSVSLLSHLRRDSAVVIGENEPYAVTDETDYSVGHHAESRGLLYAELEIRQDLITHPIGQHEWAVRLADSMNEAAAGPALLRPPR